MYTAISVLISLVLTFLITWVFAKLKIFDFIGKITLGCGTFALFRLLEVVAIFIVSFVIVNGIVETHVDKFDYTNTYLTTKVDLSIYEKVEKEPYGKEIGTLKTDTVLKLVKKNKKGTVTWLEGYILEKGNPKYIFLLVPDSNFEIKQNGKYFFFNEKSKSFSEYYNRIDNENAVILAKIREAFLSELKTQNIIVEHSASNVLRESIKKTHYFLPPNGFSNKGYFGAFKKESSNDFYYTQNENKKRFKKIVYSYYDKLEKETKPYFEKED